MKTSKLTNALALSLLVIPASQVSAMQNAADAAKAVKEGGQAAMTLAAENPKTTAAIIVAAGALGAIYKYLRPAKAVVNAPVSSDVAAENSALMQDVEQASAPEVVVESPVVAVEETAVVVEQPIVVEQNPSAYLNFSDAARDAVALGQQLDHAAYIAEQAQLEAQAQEAAEQRRAQAAEQARIVEAKTALIKSLTNPNANKAQVEQLAQAFNVTPLVNAYYEQVALQTSKKRSALGKQRAAEQAAVRLAQIKTTLGL